MRNPFKKKALTASSGVIDAVENSGWSAFPMLGGGAQQRILNQFNRAQSANYGWLYANSPAVRTVIDEIVRSVGELELRLYEEISDSERQPRPDHPAALSLRYPNEDVPSDGFIRSMVKDWLIHDNAYALLAPAADGKITLVRVPAYMVVVQGHSLFSVDNYRIWPQGAWTSIGSWGGQGTWIDVNPETMLHWHGEHPEDPRIGLSHLDTLRGVIAEDAALQQASVELANAGLQEPTWIFRPLDAPKWSNAAEAAFEEMVANKMRSRNRRPVAMDEGMELRSFGVTPHDAEMMALRRWAVAQVAGEFDLPLGKVGLEPASQESEDAMVSDVLRPLCKNMAKMLNLRLLVRVFNWTDGCYEFNLDERLMGNNRLQALTSAAGVPILLRDEARAMIGRPPVEGGDEPATPANIILGGDPEAQLAARAAAAAPKPAPLVMPIQDPNKPPQDGSYRQEQGPTPVPSRNNGKALTDAQNGSQPTFERLPQLHPRRAAEMERQRRNVDTFQGIVEKHLTRITRSLAQKKKAAAIGDADWTRWDREFSDDLDSALKRAVQAEGDIYALRLAASNFDMAEVQHYVRAMAEGAATAINDTLRKDVDDLGLDAAIARLPQHVASSGTSLGVRATIWPREEAARQSGTFQQRVKTWIADTDRHAEFDGDTVALGDDWPAGFAPGGAPNCACSLSIS